MKMKSMAYMVSALNRLTDGAYSLGRVNGHYCLWHDLESGGIERVTDRGTRLEVYKQLQAMIFVAERSCHYET